MSMEARDVPELGRIEFLGGRASMVRSPLACCSVAGVPDQSTSA